MKFIKDQVRQFLVGKEQSFTFTSNKKEPVNLMQLKEVKEINLYLHIPFCKSMCPYCPYNRISFEKKLLKRYFLALHKEIDLYSEIMGSTKISSIYIGGGTPTNAINELKGVINHINELFDFSGDLAIETTVSDINEDNLQKLKAMGVNLLSVGVQSFNDKYLELLGRDYSSKTIDNAFKLINKFEFETVNIDLIFAYPNQNKDELLEDLEKATNLPVNQITTYPLFTFPYTAVGNYLKINKIKMPNFFIRKKFYNIILKYFENNNFEMTSVWGFKKQSKNTSNYSSVTRNKYVGLGAGAGTRLENVFYFNTFSIKDYENSLLMEKKLPISIHLSITNKLSDYYWFYWKLYETNFSIESFEDHSNIKMDFILNCFRVLGLVKKKNGIINLTSKGAFWIHLIQNQFVLDYINNVWEIMKKEAFPESIDI